MAITLAYYLHHLSPFIWEIRPGFGLRWYGFAYVLAFLCGYWLYLRLAHRGYSELPPEKVSDFITWGAIFGVMIGGRLGQMIFYDWKQWMHDPLMIFRVWEGGMASHGGMLGLILFTFFYARRHKISWTSIGDSLCVVAPVGLFFGRVANFINGELYGRATTVRWAVQFPKELYDHEQLTQRVWMILSSERWFGDKQDMPLPGADFIVEAARHDARVREVLQKVLTPRHPSQLYEAMLEGVLLFCVLWFLRTKTRQPRGVLTGLFFVLYALLRIFGEMFREPEVADIGPFTYGQFLSLFFVGIGAAFIVYGMRTRRYERADSASR
jgi:phosphatidylglycerol---prolipoprotein diacylglyceryl transferase